jgi:parallel beta-helix repeat protein
VLRRHRRSKFSHIKRKGGRKMLTRKMKKMILLGLAVFAVISTGEVCFAPVYDVYDSQGLYNIQNGIGYPPLEDGDTIILHPNTYTAHQTPPPSWYAPINPPEGKHITYIGYGIEETILYGGFLSHMESRYWPCVELDPGDSAEVCNLKILCGFSEHNVNCGVVCGLQLCGFEKAGIICKNGSNLVMRNCLITEGDAPACDCHPNYVDCYVDSTSGVYCENSNVLIEDCTISIDNLLTTYEENKSPILVEGSSSTVTIIDSNISDNKPKDSSKYIIAINIGNGKSLTLEDCVFSGNRGPCVEYTTVVPDKGDATITNCTIDGGGEYPGLILRNFGNVDITGCTIKNCHSSYSVGGTGPGIWITDWPKNVRIDDCNFTGNITTTDGGKGGAIALQYCDSSTISNCSFTGNKANWGGGIYLYPNAKNVTISNCTISGNKALQQGATVAKGGGIVSSGDIINIINCKITGNEADKEHDGEGGGIWAYDNENLKIDNSIIAFNVAYKYGGAVLTLINNGEIDNSFFWENLGHTSDNELNKQQIHNGSYDSTYIEDCYIMHSTGGTYNENNYVVDEAFNESAPNVDYIFGRDLGGNIPLPPEYRVYNITQKQWYHYIQAAIDAASEGDEIMAFPSIYYENINTWGKAIKVRSIGSGYPTATIIDGSGNPGEPAVYFNDGQGPNIELKGFTVKNGS